MVNVFGLSETPDSDKWSQNILPFAGQSSNDWMAYRNWTVERLISDLKGDRESITSRNIFRRILFELFSVDGIGEWKLEEKKKLLQLQTGQLDLSTLIFFHLSDEALRIVADWTRTFHRVDVCNYIVMFNPADKQEPFKSSPGEDGIATGNTPFTHQIITRLLFPALEGRPLEFAPSKVGVVADWVVSPSPDSSSFSHYASLREMLTHL